MAAPTLETLPAELKLQVLKEIPELKTLVNFISASPEYYRLYIGCRRTVDTTLVQRQFTHVDIAEGLIAIRSEGLHAEAKGNRDAILSILDQRRRPQEIREVHGDEHPFKLANHLECVKLVHMDAKFNSLIDDFSRIAPSPPWMDGDVWRAEELPLKLSDIEKARFLRALYRIQTYCNIFGVREIPLSVSGFACPSYSSSFDFESEEMWGLFFGTMAPWEIEEITCVWIYMRNKYDEMFKELTEDLLSVDADFSNILAGTLALEFIEPRPYNNSTYYLWYLNHMVSIGPQFLQRLNEEGIDRRHEIVFMNARAYREEFVLFIDEFDKPHAFTSPADMYERGISQKSLYERSAFEQPNSAWVWFCYQAGYSDRGPIQQIAVLPRRALGSLWVREWAYALWDDSRLFEWSALLHMLEDYTNDPTYINAVYANVAYANVADATDDYATDDDAAAGEDVVGEDAAGEDTADVDADDGE